MHRSQLLGVLMLLPGMGSSSAATEIELAAGSIAIGNPLGRSIGGVSEIWSNCGDDRQMDGIDGIAFDIPTAARGRPAILTTSPSGNDADVYWLDADCRPTGSALDEAGTGNESGNVPGAARTGMVNLIQGRDAAIRLVYIPPPSSG